MSAFEEIRDNGAIGPETFDLFVWNLSALVRRYGFPPPDGGKWTRQVCEEWVQDFFVKKGLDIAKRLFASSNATEAAYTRLVRKSIHNELKDQAKATTAGKMRARLRTILSTRPEFFDATSIYAGTPAWTLESSGDAIYSGDWPDLLHTPGLKKIEPIATLNTAGPTSRANADKLATAARIILEAAGGALRDQVLASAIVQLFEIDNPDLYLDPESERASTTSSGAFSPENHSEAIEAADRLILALSADEGRALLVLDEPTSTAALYLPNIDDVVAFLEEVKAKVRQLVGEEPLPAGTFTLVTDWFNKLPRA